MKIYIKLKISFNINNNNTDYKQNMDWIIKKQKKYMKSLSHISL